jgi:SAM-dependent methyltransferase
MDISALGRVITRYEAAELDRTIDPADVMWKGGPDWYWSVGRSGLECVLLGLAASPLAEPQSILDLACGHGRVARHLRAAFPEAHFFWCDVEGAEFCARRFGGEAIQSSHELLDVRLPSVDVVWIGSLFTHVNERRARAWLAHVAGCLNPGGVMVATFHGRISTRLYRRARQGDMAQLDRLETECRISGWAYEAYDRAVDAGWGYSLTTLARIAEIAAAVPDTRIGGLAEGAWAANHDVLTLVRIPDNEAGIHVAKVSPLKKVWWSMHERLRRRGSTRRK